MKHFLVELTYTVPLERIDELVSAHRAHLQTGYQQGLLLMSGPQNPKTGGVIIARASSKEALEQFFAKDPYLTSRAATYRYLEFNPVLKQPFMDSWISAS